MSLGSTAIHEAGHAVIGRVLDLACGAVTIEPDYDDGSWGCATIWNGGASIDRWQRRGLDRDEDVALRAAAITAMAGAEAERLILGEAGPGDGDDQYWIAVYLAQLGIPEARQDAVEARLRRFARTL